MYACPGVYSVEEETTTPAEFLCRILLARRESGLSLQIIRLSPVIQVANRHSFLSPFSEQQDHLLSQKGQATFLHISPIYYFLPYRHVIEYSVHLHIHMQHGKV